MVTTAPSTVEVTPAVAGVHALIAAFTLAATAVALVGLMRKAVHELVVPTPGLALKAMTPLVSVQDVRAAPE
jgi:hypothetical protein